MAKKAILMSVITMILTACSAQPELPTLVPFPTDSPEPTDTATITNTPEPSLTPVPDDQIQGTQSALSQSIAGYQGVERVQAIDISYDANGDMLFYAEITVSRGTDRLQLSSDLKDYVTYLSGVSAFGDFTMILDDGREATIYIFNAVNNGWSVTSMDAFNTTRSVANTATAAARPTNTRRPPTQRPPVNTSNTSNTGSRSQPAPRNCSTAVAMGLSAVQAAQYSRLDADGDGVACYGD